MSVGIVYSANKKMLRRIEIPAQSGGLIPGELRAIVSDSNYSRFGPDLSLRLALGVAALPNPNCAVIDANGNVVNTIAADDSIDSIPGFTLMNDPNVQVGWTLVNGVLTPPAVAVPPT